GLRICWDQKTHHCTVFNLLGERLTEWEVPETDRAENGQIALQNKGRDLALDLLRVRAWDGNPPAPHSASLPRVELLDGQSVEGEISGETPGTIAVRRKGSDAAESYPLTSVGALILSAVTSEADPKEPTLAFADGALLRGRITSIQQGQAMLETSFSEGPF